MNYLEEILRQFYDWKGCVVKHNMKVGKRAKGGYAGELDVVVYDPERKCILHYEPSTDADKWSKREERYRKKFSLGRKHIHTLVFPWLPKSTAIEQIAVFYNVKDGSMPFLGGRAISIDNLMRQIRLEIEAQGPVIKKAIPEKYPILRSIQLIINGYSKPLP